MNHNFERSTWALFFLALSGLVASRVAARAPDTFEEMHARPTVIESPQWYAFEFRVGPYVPDNGDPTFKKVFGSDRGWMLGLEFDVTLWHIPYVGQLNLGAGWAWADYKAKAFDTSAADTGSARAGESTEFTLYPMSALGVLRVDTLARHLDIPVTLTGKIGYDFVRWRAETGGEKDGTGLNMGLRWGAQAALELDFFEEDSARTLDQEYGINHTFLFGEFFNSETKGTGDRTFALGFGTVF